MPVRIFYGQPARIGVFAAMGSIATAGRHAGSVRRGLVIPGAVYQSAPFNACLGKRVGPGRLIGTVKIKGTPDAPVIRPVVAFNSASYQPLAVTTSAADGSYRFNGLPVDPVFVVAFDPTCQYRAVIADNLIPEVAP